jgi:beta-1,2-mannobiose phosphorylase / 1,2-beta-oligomannan phosphorylase
MTMKPFPHPSRRRLLLTASAASAAMLAGVCMAGAGRRMMYSESTRLGRPFAKDPGVVRFAGRYLMYYTIPAFDKSLARPDGPRGWGIGIAQSTNLIDWKRVGELRPEQECERNGFCAPGAWVLDGRVHLFYQSYGNGPRDAICHAVSEDGFTFRRNPTNPIFRPTGDWNSGRAIDANVIEHDGRLLLYAATRDPSSKIQQLVVAAADRRSDFSRPAWRQMCDEPILKPELPWEQQCIEAPALCRHGDKLYMFYAGAYNNAPQQIGCAISEDGLKWKRLFTEPLVPNGRPGEWNSSESGHPFAFTDDDGQVYLFHQGNNDRGRTWWLSQVKIGWRDQRPYVIA